MTSRHGILSQILPEERDVNRLLNGNSHKKNLPKEHADLSDDIFVQSINGVSNAISTTFKPVGKLEVQKKIKKK